MLSTRPAIRIVPRDQDRTGDILDLSLARDRDATVDIVDVSKSGHDRRVHGVRDAGSLFVDDETSHHSNGPRIAGGADVGRLVAGEALTAVVVGGGKTRRRVPVQLVAGAYEDVVVLDVRIHQERPVLVTGSCSSVRGIPRVVEVGGRVRVVRILGVERDAERHLLDVAEVLGFLRRVLRLGENGEEDGSENRDDRDDNEKLDQGKCTLTYGHSPLLGRMRPSD